MAQHHKKTGKTKHDPPETEIIEAYLALCRRYGAANVTLQAVAKHSRVSFGKVHYYFGGKNRGLADSAAAYVGQSAQAFTTRELSENEGQHELTRVDAYVVATFKWTQELPNHASFWLYYYYLTSVESPYREAHGLILKKARSRIGALIYESIGRKQIPEIPGLADPKFEEELCTRIHNVLIGGAIAAFTDPGPDAYSRHLSATLECVRRLLKVTT